LKKKKLSKKGWKNCQVVIKLLKSFYKVSKLKVLTNFKKLEILKQSEGEGDLKFLDPVAPGKNQMF
jgi:hypothetical protein